MGSRLRKGQMAMKQWKRDLILGVAILAFCVISYVYSYNLTDSRAKYFLAKADTYVMIWLVLLAVLSIVLILRSIKRKSDEVLPPILTKRILLTALIIVAYVFSMDKIGFFVSSFFFVFALLFFFTREEKGNFPQGKAFAKMILIWVGIAAASVTMVQYLFGNLLGIRLPAGLFG